MTGIDSPRQDQLPAALHTLLTLVSMDPLPDGSPMPGLPGTWSPRLDGLPGARVQLAPGESMLVNGAPTGGVINIDSTGQTLQPSPTVALDAAHGILVITLSDAVSGDMIWVGVTSETAPRLRAFRGVSSYPYDGRWRIPVSFTPAGADERISSVQMWRSDDPQHDMARVAGTPRRSTAGGTDSASTARATMPTSISATPAQELNPTERAGSSGSSRTQRTSPSSTSTRPWSRPVRSTP